MTRRAENTVRAQQYGLTKEGVVYKAEVNQQQPVFEGTAIHQERDPKKRANAQAEVLSHASRAVGVKAEIKGAYAGGDFFEDDDLNSSPGLVAGGLGIVSLGAAIASALFLKGLLTTLIYGAGTVGAVTLGAGFLMPLLTVVAGIVIFVGSVWATWKSFKQMVNY